MYLPPHELRMWNSRLYCAYCIMDIQDEEHYGKKGHRDGAGSGAAPGSDGAQQGSGISGGTCERCGKQSDSLYFVGGRRLCSHCQSEEGGAPGAASFFSQLVLIVKEKFGGAPKPVVRGGSSEPQAPRQPSPKGSIAPAPREQVFDIKNRQMQEKKPAIQGENPISEKRQPERKPSAQSKESFFGLHPSAKDAGAPKKK
jgi:hypothetical protein